MPTDPTPAGEPELAADSVITRSSAEPFRTFIAAATAKGRNAKAIYEDLVEHHGYTGSYDAVKRFARKLRRRDPKLAAASKPSPGKKRKSTTARARSPEIRAPASIADQDSLS